MLGAAQREQEVKKDLGQERAETDAGGSAIIAEAALAEDHSLARWWSFLLGLCVGSFCYSALIGSWSAFIFLFLGMWSAVGVWWRTKKTKKER